MTLASEPQMLRSQQPWTQGLFRGDTTDESDHHWRAGSGASVGPVQRPHTLFSSAIPSSKEYQKESNTDNSRSQSETSRRMGNHGGSSWSMPLNYKTEFCIKFQESGHCSFEDRCQFVHHPHELQRRSRALTYKTQPCWSGVDCPYQKNHTRCIYLHGDETAEMFDQQRGISFAKVQKIMARKETKQLRQQQQQQRQPHNTPPSQAGPGTTVPFSSSVAIQPDDESPTSMQGGNAIDIPSLRHVETFSWSGLWARPQDSASSSLASISSFLSASSDSSFTSTSSSFDKPSRSLKPLTILPPASFGASLPAAPTDVSSTLVSTAATMPELFSPGVMPVFERPFSSHEQIHEWKDPCFMNEDMKAVSRTGSATTKKTPDQNQAKSPMRTTFKKPPRVAIMSSSDPSRARKTLVAECKKGSLFALALKWSAGDDRERRSSQSGSCYELW